MSIKKETQTATLGDRLRKAREAAGLSKAQLAARLDLDDGYIGHLERGRRQPSARTSKDLATDLGIRVEWLRTGDEPMRSVETPSVTIATLATIATEQREQRKLLAAILNTLEAVRMSLDRGRADRLRRGPGPLPETYRGSSPS